MFELKDEKGQSKKLITVLIKMRTLWKCPVEIKKIKAITDIKKKYCLEKLREQKKN